eukprot:Nk52_evm23s2152 gene=Nk52_evmTU23s2152
MDLSETALKVVKGSIFLAKSVHQRKKAFNDFRIDLRRLFGAVSVAQAALYLLLDLIDAGVDLSRFEALILDVEDALKDVDKFTEKLKQRMYQNGEFCFVLAYMMGSVGKDRQDMVAKQEYLQGTVDNIIRLKDLGDLSEFKAVPQRHGARYNSTENSWGAWGRVEEANEPVVTRPGEQEGGEEAQVLSNERQRHINQRRHELKIQLLSNSYHSSGEDKKAIKKNRQEGVTARRRRSLREVSVGENSTRSRGSKSAYSQEHTQENGSRPAEEEVDGPQDEGITPPSAPSSQVPDKGDVVEEEGAKDSGISCDQDTLLQAIPGVESYLEENEEVDMKVPKQRVAKAESPIDIDISHSVGCHHKTARPMVHPQPKKGIFRSLFSPCFPTEVKCEDLNGMSMRQMVQAQSKKSIFSSLCNPHFSADKTWEDVLDDPTFAISCEVFLTFREAKAHQAAFQKLVHLTKTLGNCKNAKADLKNMIQKGEHMIHRSAGYEDKFFISIMPEVPCYLYVFSVETDGCVRILYSSSSQVATSEEPTPLANTTDHSSTSNRDLENGLVVPEEEYKYNIFITPSSSRETIQVLGLTSPLEGVVKDHPVLHDWEGMLCDHSKTISTTEFLSNLLGLRESADAGYLEDISIGTANLVFEASNHNEKRNTLAPVEPMRTASQSC